MNSETTHSKTTPPSSPRESYCDSLLNSSTGFRKTSECCAPVRNIKKISPEGHVPKFSLDESQ